MQLSCRNISREVTAISAAALTPLANAESISEPWQYDVGLLTFTEVDRVSGVELYYSSFKDFAPDDLIRWKISVDVLVGSSFNGASPTDTAQTFARPSGRSQVKIAPGEYAFDNIFQDNRVDIGFSRSKPISSLWNYAYGAGVSYEYDYVAADGNIGIGRYFNRKNTRLGLGYSVEFADIDPEGGVPFAFDEPGEPGNTPVRRAGKDNKHVHDVLFGVTQVMNRQWTTQWNLGFAFADGYLTDPYKVVSVIDPARNGATDHHEYEHRPDFKRRYVAYHESRFKVAANTFSFAYRYTSDSWGMQSNSIQTTVMQPIDSTRFWELNARFYQQDGADFYRHSILLDESPRFMSADLRLAEFTALTAGIKYGKRDAAGAGWSARIEYYTQFGNERPADAVGLQQDYDLFPQLHAVRFQYLIHLR